MDKQKTVSEQEARLLQPHFILKLLRTALI